MSIKTKALLFNPTEQIYLAYGHVITVYDTDALGNHMAIVFNRLQNNAFQLLQPPVGEITCDINPCVRIVG